MRNKPRHVDEISTQKLKLREFLPEDNSPLHRILSNPAVHRYMPNQDLWPLDKVKKWVEMGWQHWMEKGYGWWAVELKESSELIGWCGLNYLEDTDEVEVLYLLGERCWGRGLATEAARATVRYAFDIADLHRLVGIVHPENVASRRVLEKIGMSSNGRGHYFGIEVVTYLLERPSSRLPQMGTPSGITGK